MKHARPWYHFPCCITHSEFKIIDRNSCGEKKGRSICPPFTIQNFHLQVWEELPQIARTSYGTKTLKRALVMFSLEVALNYGAHTELESQTIWKGREGIVPPAKRVSEKVHHALCFKIIQINMQHSDWTTATTPLLMSHPPYTSIRFLLSLSFSNCIRRQASICRHGHPLNYNSTSQKSVMHYTRKFKQCKKHGGTFVCS